MKKLLSLPPNLVECFHDIEHANHQEWFCTSDPVGSKLGSGGGTAWLLQACKNSESDTTPLTEWLAHEKTYPATRRRPKSEITLICSFR